MPSFNANQLNAIEWETGRIVRAVSQFADKKTCDTLRDAVYILAEVRNAGRFLCDANTDSDTRHQVVVRLCELFSEDSIGEPSEGALLEALGPCGK